MSDVFSRQQRSNIMARIGSRDTAPEKLVRSTLHEMGFRFRLHVKSLPGKPDIVLPRYRKIIFVNGCFWHGHSRCKRSYLPDTNTRFWKNKIQGNILRDHKTIRQLRKLGWDILVVWQCQTKKHILLANRLRKFMDRRQGEKVGCT